MEWRLAWRVRAPRRRQWQWAGFEMRSEMHHEMTTETVPSKSAFSRRVSGLRRISVIAGVLIASSLIFAVPLATAQGGGPVQPTNGQPGPPPDGRMTGHGKCHGQDRTVTIHHTNERIA